MDGRVPIAVTAVYADGGPLSLPIPRDVDASKLSANFDPNRLGQFRRTDAQTTLISTSVSTSAGSSPSSSPRLRLGAGGAEAIRTYGTASRHWALPGLVVGLRYGSFVVNKKLTFQLKRPPTPTASDIVF